MQTIGMWQSANIEFLNQNDYDNLVQRWSIPFKADLIRIFPFLNTNQIKNERNMHTIRLTNLPPGTTGFDFKDIIKNNKVQTCYIPRTRNYLRKRFAILSFKSAEDLQEACDNNIHFRQHTTSLDDSDTKICAICSSDNHLAKDCEIKALQQKRAQDKKDNAKKFGHLIQRFKPTGTTAMQKYIQTINRSNKPNNRSYADALKQPQNKLRQPLKQTPKPTYQNPISQFTTNNNEPSISDIMKALNQIGEELKNIRSELNNMDDRIGCLEEDAYEYHTYSEKDEQMKDDISEHPQDPLLLQDKHNNQIKSL